MARFRRPLSLKALANLCHQLAMMEDAGVPVLRAFRVLAGETKARGLRDLYLAVHDAIERGSTLSAALREQGGAFPPMLVEVIAGCEASGSLYTGLQELDRYFTLRLAEFRLFLKQTTYPACVVAAMVFFIPLLRAFLLDTAAGQRGHMASTLRSFAVPAGLLLAFYVVHWFGITTRARRGLMRRVWPFNRLRRNLGNAQLLWCLGLFHGSGLSPAATIRLATAAADMPELKPRAEVCIQYIERGCSWQEAIGRSGLLPREAMSMVVAGEEAGALDATFKKMAEYIRERTEFRRKTMLGMIEAVCIVILGLMILLGYGR